MRIYIIFWEIICLVMDIMKIFRKPQNGVTSVDLLRWVGDDDGEGDSAGTDADNNDATTFQEDAHE